MVQRKVVQTRVDPETADHLRERAKEQHTTLADYLRTILDAHANPETTETGAILKDGFLHDIYSIGTTDSDYHSIRRILHDNWDRLTDSDLREPVRDRVLNNSSTIYITGEGSSLAVSQWLAARLQDKGFDTVVAAPEDIPIPALDARDTLIAISRSGASKSIHALIQRTTDNTEASIIGFTTGLDEAGDAADLENALYEQVQLPVVNERIAPYATRSVILQMAVLQTVLLEDTPDLETMETRFSHVEEFIRAQLEFGDVTGEPVDEDWDGLELDNGQKARLDPACQLSQTAEALELNGDLVSDALISSLGHYHPLGREASQTHHGFLHTHAEHVNLGSIRHSRLNVLYRGNAYLITALPDSEKEKDAYRRCYDYLFGYETAIENLLTWPSNSPGLRLIVFSYNEDRDRTNIEDRTETRSEYRDDGVVYLPDHRTDDATNGFANDVTLVVANYLLVYAILDRRWEQDRQLRDEVMSGPTDRRI